MAKSKAKPVRTLAARALTVLTTLISAMSKKDDVLAKAETSNTEARTSVVQHCREMGLTSSDFVAPKKGGKGGTLTSMQYDVLKASVAKGYFSAKAIAMLQAIPASLPKGEPVAPYLARNTGNRRYWVQQTGSRMNDLKGLLARGEAKLQAEKDAAREAKKSQSTKDKDERKRDDIAIINALTTALFLGKKKASGSIPNSWDEAALSELIEAAIAEVGGSMKVSQHSTVGDTEIKASLKQNVTDKLKSK
mgnify:FL=1